MFPANGIAEEQKKECHDELRDIGVAHQGFAMVKNPSDPFARRLKTPILSCGAGWQVVVLRHKAKLSRGGSPLVEAARRYASDVYRIVQKVNRRPSCAVKGAPGVALVL